MLSPSLLLDSCGVRLPLLPSHPRVPATPYPPTRLPPFSSSILIHISTPALHSSPASLLSPSVPCLFCCNVCVCTYMHDMI